MKKYLEININATVLVKFTEAQEEKYQGWVDNLNREMNQYGLNFEAELLHPKDEREYRKFQIYDLFKIVGPLHVGMDVPFERGVMRIPLRDDAVFGSDVNEVEEE